MADEVESQKRALLSAIAQQGAQGRETLAASQAGLESGRTGAMDASFARSGQINAPLALNTALGTQAAAPFDASLKDRQIAQLAYGQQIGGINALNSNYMDQVSAARPVVSAITNTQIAKIQAEQARVAAANKYQDEDQAFQRQQRDESHKTWEQNNAANAAAIEQENKGKAVQQRVNGSNLSVDAKDTFTAAAAYGDFGSASSALEAQKAALRAGTKDANGKKTSQAEIDRKIADLDAVYPYLREYFGINYTSPVAAPQAPTTAPQAPNLNIAKDEHGIPVRAPKKSGSNPIANYLKKHYL